MREHSVLLAHSTGFKHNPQQLETFAMEVALKALAHKGSQLAPTDLAGKPSSQIPQLTPTAQFAPSLRIKLFGLHP